MTVLGLTFASIVYLYVRLCRRWPAAGWLAFGFFAGLFGWQRPVYVHTEVSVDDEGNEVTVYDDNCDAAYRRHLLRRWRRLVGRTGRLR